MKTIVGSSFFRPTISGKKSLHVRHLSFFSDFLIENRTHLHPISRLPTSIWLKTIVGGSFFGRTVSGKKSLHVRHLSFFSDFLIKNKTTFPSFYFFSP